MVLLDQREPAPITAPHPVPSLPKASPTKGTQEDWRRQTRLPLAQSRACFESQKPLVRCSPMLECGNSILLGRQIPLASLER